MVLLESASLEYGKSIQNYNLPDMVSGKNFSNQDLDKELVVIAFICNHCPYVVRIIKEFSALALRRKDEVDFVAISANDPDYREEDSPENMKLFAEQNEFSFPYLFDEKQSVAKAFGAMCTPDIFVYKKGVATSPSVSGNDEYGLAYHARFEDLDKAISDLLIANKISFEDLPSAGCSIKWIGRKVQ